MKIKKYNYDRIKEKDVNDSIIRVKALMINSQEEILLGNAFGTYQFPGGHQEKKETLSETLIREIKEETGITLPFREYEPFFAIKYYLKDYPVLGNNRSIELYYFCLFTDEKYHLEKRNLDDQERTGDFTLTYVPLKDIKKVLEETQEKQKINRLIEREMLLAVHQFKKERRKLWKKNVLK